MVLLPMSSPFSRGLHFCRMRRTSYTMDGFCLLYLLLILLMRSGDVETNPGPNTAESNVSEREFLKLAKAIPPSYYEDVGIILGIPHAQLQAILVENLKNYTNALLDVFMKWNVLQPTLSNKRQLLADKLRELDLDGLSDGLLNGPQIPNIPGIMVDKDALFDELSRRFPAEKYVKFCNKMGVNYKVATSVLARFQDDYSMALRHLLSQWDQRMKGVTREQLEDALDEADVGGLGAIVEKHYGKEIMVDKDALFDELSKKMPAGRYPMFCDKMGVSYHEATSILRRYNEDYDMALRDLLSLWDLNMNGVTRKQLEDALDRAEVGGLRAIVKKHYEKASTEVATICSSTQLIYHSFDYNVSDMEFLKLAKEIQPSDYYVVGISLGFPYAELRSILIQKMKNYTNAFLHVFMKWNVMQRPPHSNKRQLLADKLREINLGGLSDRLLDGPPIPNIPEVILSQPGNLSSREMTAHTGPSTSASAGIPPQDASTDGAASSSSSKASKHVDPGILEMELHDLAKKLGNHTDLQKLAIKLGANHASWMQYKASNTSRDGRISIKGTHDMLVDWKKNTPQVSQKVLLNEALKDAGFAELADDTDNNEGNGGQPTSFKPDSGSNQDDISFGGLSAPPEILARGERAQQAYAEAAKAGTKKVYRTRLMLVGQERVGKTSLKKTLTGQGFDKDEAITYGVETGNTCKISIEDAKTGGKMWSILKKGLGNEDKNDDEYSKALADEMTKRLKMTPPQDQESSEPPRDTTLSRGPNAKEAGDETAKRLTMTPPKDQESLGTLSDSSLGRVLNPDAAEEFVSGNVETPNAKEEDGGVPHHLASLVEKNLKEQEMGTDSTESGRGEAVSLSIWDFAGHDVYYTTHQVFLTWRAIYVIVFDLSRSLDSDVPLESKEKSEGDAKSKLTCLEFINFWLCSIYAHAVPPLSKDSEESPTIFIVGTHRESVKGNAEEKRKKITSAFKKIHDSIEEKPFQHHVVPKYYAIENSFEDKDEKIGELRKDIVEEAMKESYMGEEIPIRWLKFEEALAADKKNHLSLDETKVLTQPMGIEPERGLLTMLTFYHDLGYVVYYGGIEDQKSLLRDMVILNPQWLIDVFKQVITIPNREKWDWKKKKVSADLTTLKKYGILEDTLIEHMWQDKNEPKEFLVKLMDKFDLICDAPVDTEVSTETEKGVKKRYYVPSRLKAHCSPKEIAQIKSTDFYVDFGGFLPDGLFHRLMTRAVRWKEKRERETVKLFYRQIQIPLEDKHQAFLEMLPPPEATIKVTVFREVVDGSWDSHQPPAPNAVKKVYKDFVKRNLDSLKQHWAKRIKYDVCILCPCPNPSCCEKPLLVLDCCLNEESITCGIYNISTAAIKSKFGEEGVESGNKSPVMPKGSSRQPSTTDFDDILVAVAKRVRKVTEIDTLGKKLGFSPEDIHGGYIATNNKNQNVTYEGTLQMLRDWRKGQTNSTERGALKTALEQSGQIGLADDLFPSFSNTMKQLGQLGISRSSRRWSCSVL